MRSLYRTLDRKTVRDIGLLLLADTAVGLSFGAIAAGFGMPLWVPVALSVLVFAGGSQFLAVGLVGAGASPVTAVFAGLLLNLRHIPFGLAVADVLGQRLAAKAAGIHVMIDESVAFAMAQPDRRRARAAYWLVGTGLFVAWNIGTVAGALAGSAVRDVDAFGVDAAFPAVILALIMPSFGDRRTLLASVLGVLVAVVATPLLPGALGLPVLLALLGLAVLAWRRGARTGPAAGGGTGESAGESTGENADEDADEGGEARPCH